MAHYTKPTNAPAQRPIQLTGEQKHLYELLAHFSTVMLGTFEQVGGTPTLRARPMGVAKLEDDCTMHFISAIDSPKIDEAQQVQLAHVFGQSATRFFTLRGRLQVTQDRTLLRTLWHRFDDVWFSGPEDPRVAALTFQPEEAELWDASGAHGVRFLFAAARALLSGVPAIQDEQEQHQRFGISTISRYTSGGNAD